MFDAELRKETRKALSTTAIACLTEIVHSQARLQSMQ